MPLNPTSPSATELLALQGRSRALPTWRVGQLLQALATRDAAQGQVTLRIGAHQVQAQTSLPIRAGQRMTLEVAETGPRTVLRLQQGPTEAETVRQAVRQALPRQSALARPVAGALAMARDGAQATALPRPVVNAAQAVSQQVLPARSVDAQTLQAAVRDSGLFLEAKLAHAARNTRAPALAGDLKARLLRLAEALRAAPTPHTSSAPKASPSTSQQPSAPAPATPPPGPGRVARPQPSAPIPAAPARAVGAELGAQTEGALARIQLNQLASQPPERAQGTQPTQQWVIELPIRTAERVDVWQLQVQRDPAERDGGEGDSGGARWSVDLAFELEGLGPVRARVSLVGETVSVRFWSEAPTTQARFANALGQLAERLDAAGIPLGALVSHYGQPTGADPEGEPPWSGLLQDEA